MIRAVVREGLGEDRIVNFMLDEAASLGPLDCIEDLLDKYRGYGCRAQFYYQSAGQLAKCWTKDKGQTLLSNTSKIFFGVADMDTANLVSSMLGKETIIVESGGSNRGRSRGTSTSTGTSFSDGVNANHSTGSSENWAQAPRELLKPEEVLTLPPRAAITFPGAGLPPVATSMIRYFEEPGLFKGGGRLPRLLAACRTLAKSVLLLAAGLGLAAALTVTLERQEAQPPASPNWQAPQAPATPVNRPPRPTPPARPKAGVPFVPDPAPRRDKLA
jgi:type IV secretion system protein VirD4